MREHIIEAALQLYSEKPPQDVSVKEVAERAGVSAGLIFHYFRSKEGLEREAALYFLEKQASPGPRDISDFVEKNLKLIKDSPGVFRFLQYVFEKERYSRRGELAARVYEEGLSALEPLLRREGVKSPKKVATILIALIDGLALHSFFLGLDVEEYRDLILELIRCWR